MMSLLCCSAKWKCSSGRLLAGAGLVVAGLVRVDLLLGRVERDLDVDFERRDLVAALHLHADLVVVDLDVLGDGTKDFVAQLGDQVRTAGRCTLMREQHLQAVAGGRSRLLWTGKETKQVHAAFLPNILPK